MLRRASHKPGGTAGNLEAPQTKRAGGGKLRYFARMGFGVRGKAPRLLQGRGGLSPVGTGDLSFPQQRGEGLCCAKESG